MKTKKTLTTFIGLLLVTYGVFAQNNGGQPVKQAIIFGNENDFRAIKAEGVTYDNVSGEVRICLMEVNYASKLKSKGMFVAGTSSTQYNRLLLFNFGTGLVFKGITGDAYTLSGGDLDNLNSDMSTSKIATKSFTDIKQNYPAFFTAPANYTVVTSLPYLFGMSNETKSFDQGVNEYIVNKEAENITLSRKKSAENLSPSQKYCIDNINQTVTTYFGKKMEEKYSDQKYLVFVTYDQKGNMLNTFEVNFLFPRNLKASFLLRSKTNPNEVAGKVFFFERMMMFGKKFNDPEKNNYEVVACDAKGKLILHKTFKVGDPDKSDFLPFYTILDGNKVWALGHFKNAATYGLIIKTFGPDSAETTKEIDKDAVLAKRIYDKNVSQRSSSALDKVGFTFSLFDQFYGMGNIMAANGDLLIYGKMTRDIDDPNYKPQQGQSTLMKPQVTQYRDFVCFQITPTSDIADIYNSIMPDAFEPGSISVIPANDKVIISTTLSRRPLSQLELQMFKVPSIASTQTWAYPYKSMFAPKFMAITPSAGKIDSQSPSDGSFTLFTPEKYYVVVPEKNVLYYYGFALDKKKKGQLNLYIDEFKF